ncbi:MAG: helix-turn-helix domain containing protein [Gammaproteobacteria bacterium]
MRCSASEKYEIIQLVEQSSLSVKQTLRQLDIHNSTFYNWLKRFYDNGIDGLEDRKPSPNTAWNKIPDEHYDAILKQALDQPELSPRAMRRKMHDDNQTRNLKLMS